MVVISVSLPSKELRDFDEVWRRLGFTSRSDSVRDALHKYVVQNKWTSRCGSEGHFLISVVYDGRKTQHVAEVMHSFGDIIHSSMHTHFQDTCVEQMVLIGDMSRIQGMFTGLASLTGVRICNCIV
ncbi:MAG: ribbon-helix-helix protein, CopG family [Euryarchaeota archaeon]|nr:ribbon-helix-helix protein, CopG family [Euryarchaeota archaeon]